LHSPRRRHGAIIESQELKQVATLPAIDSELVALIGAIYDAVLEPTGWHDALDRIRLHFDLQNCIMGLNRFRHDPMTFVLPVNVPDQYLALTGPEYAAEILRM